MKKLILFFLFFVILLFGGCQKKMNDEEMDPLVNNGLSFSDVQEMGTVHHLGANGKGICLICFL